jgi:hypothetical protein
VTAVFLVDLPLDHENDRVIARYRPGVGMNQGPGTGYRLNCRSIRAGSAHCVGKGLPLTALPVAISCDVSGSLSCFIARETPDDPDFATNMKCYIYACTMVVAADIDSNFFKYHRTLKKIIQGKVS